MLRTLALGHLTFSNHFFLHLVTEYTGTDTESWAGLFCSITKAILACLKGVYPLGQNFNTIPIPAPSLVLHHNTPHIAHPCTGPRGKHRTHLFIKIFFVEKKINFLLVRNIQKNKKVFCKFPHTAMGVLTVHLRPISHRRSNLRVWSPKYEMKITKSKAA